MSLVEQIEKRLRALPPEKQMEAVFDANIVIDALKGVDEADIEYNRYERVMISLITWMEGNNLPSQAVLRFAEKTVHE